MGVCGSGKTTIGRLLAQQTGWPFYDGDDFHPRANVEKMARGEALGDADRQPWLELLAARIDGWLAEGSAILACSALKESYRQTLVGGRSQVRLVYLKGSKDLIRQRLAARVHRYMPPTLLDSQFAALEEPTDALVVEVSSTPEAALTHIRSLLEA
ncbi:MAG: gluconokinase [Candidatus Latescibacteria bacterium]|nr:gluconokinase [Candidatus Latescibacterota bacterium]